MCSSFLWTTPSFLPFLLFVCAVGGLPPCTPAVRKRFLGIMQPAPFWDALAHSTHGLSLSPSERGGERVLQNAAFALPSLRLCRACVRVCATFPVLACRRCWTEGGGFVARPSSPWHMRTQGTHIMPCAHQALRAKCPPLLTAATVLSCSRFRSQPWPSKSPTFGWTSTAAMASPSHALPC